MNKYGRFGSLKATDGNGKDLLKILLEAANIVSEIKGCKQYLVGKDLKDPDLIWVSEIWDSKEDHTASLKNENVRQLIGKAMPILDQEADNKGSEMMFVDGLELN